MPDPDVPVGSDPTQPAPTPGPIVPPFQPLVVPSSARPAPLVPLGLPEGTALGSIGEGASPAIQQLQNQLLRNFGMGEEPRDPLTGAIAAPLKPFAEMVQKYYPASRPLPKLFDEYSAVTDALPAPAVAPRTFDWTAASQAMWSGLAESPYGSLLQFDQMRKQMSMHAEPGYNYFEDRQIYNAGLANQIYLFNGSQSRDMTSWMIDRIRKKQDDAAYIDSFGAPGQVAKFLGGILGDPLTYLPTTLGLKGAQLATRLGAGAASGLELKAISGARRVLWGSVADSMASMSLTAGTHLSGQLIAAQTNPGTQLDDVLDSLFLPTAIAGSAQFVSSAFARRTNTFLKDQVRDPAFLRGRAPTGARYVPDDFIGPVIHPSDEAASALVSRYDDPLRRMQRVDYSDYHVGKIGKQPEVPYNGLSRDGDFLPHSLATNYGPLRSEEALADPATAAILRTTGAHPGLVVGGIDTGKGIPRTIKGGWVAGTPVGEAAVKKTRLVDQVFEPGELERAGAPDTTSADVAALPGTKRMMPSRLFESVEHGTQQGYVVMPDGKIFELGEGFMGPGGVSPNRNGARGLHSAFFAHFPDMSQHAMRLVRFGDELAADVPAAGRTEQQTAALRGLKAQWDRQGLGNRIRFDTAPIVDEATGVSRKATLEETQAAAAARTAVEEKLPPELPADRKFGREPAGYNADGEAIYEKKDGSRTIMLEGGRPIEEPINDIGKERGQLFGGSERGDRFKLASETGEPGAAEGSVGAALNPASQVYRREVLLAQGRMAPTGIGLEHLPLDPVSRTFQGLSVAAMQLVADLVSPGGRLTVGNLAGRTMGIRAPIEQLFEANWGKPTVDLLRSQHDSWHEYRKALAKAGGQTGIAPVNYAGRTDADRLGYEVGQAALGLIDRGDPGISFNAFRERVAKALNNGDVDELTDSASKYVNREAQAQRGFYSRTRDKAAEVGVFDEAFQKSKDLAQSELVALKKEADDIARKSRLEGWDPERTRAAEEALITRTEDAQFRMRQTEKQLENLRANGPALNGTATSYRPRLWDVGELTRLEGDFVTEISDWLKMKSGGTLDTPEAVRQAKEIHGLVSRQNPVYDRGDMAALFQSVASPSSAMARSLTIPDKMIEKYLINDSETLLRYHAKQMGTAIEMKQRFGSLDLKEQIAEIEQEYRGLMKRSADETASPPGDAYKAQFEKAEGVPWAPLPPVEDLQKMSKGAIEDMQVLRDRLYGTHGASAEPHNWTSRTIRMAKQFANITLLGMSGVSSLGDFVRPLMTEGLDAMYGYGLRTLMSDARGTILNLARKDMELAGTGMDLMNNVRALQAADTGDVFGSRGRLEHALGQANEWFFVANGLNQLTQWSKRWSSIMIQGRMNAALEDFMQAGNFADRTDLARFANFNIDETMAARIGLQLKIYGKDFGNIKLANLGAWRDETAAELYKSALNQSINRTVVTPGVGDRSNWMSTELGSLVSQYKAWGVANLNRSLVSGLQEGGNQFWYGAAAAVGFAILLNEVRSRLFYDHSTFDRPATAVIADGVDRSSILGWFSDANRAIETLTGNRLGFKPLMGAVRPHPVDIPQAAGTVLGPAAGQAVRAGSVLNDFIQNHPTAKTYNNWRSVIPGNTLPYLDPVFDRTISDGNFRTGMQRSAQRQGKETVQ